MVSKSVPKGRQMRVFAEQQPRCEVFQQQECTGGQTNSRGSSIDLRITSERSSSNSTNRFDEQEGATSSNSPHNYIKESKYMLDNCLVNNHPIQNCRPSWACRRYNPSIEGLDQEIRDYYRWLKPTAEEIACRRRLFNSITVLIKRIWPHAEVKMFGSVATNSFLPSSDIDICVMTGDKLLIPNHLNSVADVLRGTQDFENITVLDKTAVPIVKCAHKQTQLRIDINFNLTYVCATVDWIQNKIENIWQLEPLLLVLKQFLAQHGFNNPFNGGLASYALAVMLVYFLETVWIQNIKDPIQKQHYYSITSNGKRSLGLLLHYFLYYFGFIFDYAHCGIDISSWEEGMVVRREELALNLGEDVYTSCLWICDPVKNDNNLGKSAHNIMAIKNAFAEAYFTIMTAINYCNFLPTEFKRRFYYGPILSLVISNNGLNAHREENIANSREWLFAEHSVATAARRKGGNVQQQNMKVRNNNRNNSKINDENAKDGVATNKKSSNNNKIKLLKKNR